VLLLIPHMGVYAMPAAYTLAAFCGVTGLLARLYGRTPFADRFMLWEAGKILAAVIIMAAVVLLVKTLPLDNRLLAAAVPAAAGGAVYFLTAHLFRVKAMKERIK
jgi:O-antigen/teichoic acid export membrane protein